jgi:hypothetical protein
MLQCIVLPESWRPHTEATALRSSLVSLDATLRLTAREPGSMCIEGYRELRRLLGMREDEGSLAT